MNYLRSLKVTFNVTKPRYSNVVPRNPEVLQGKIVPKLIENRIIYVVST